MRGAGLVRVLAIGAMAAAFAAACATGDHTSSRYTDPMTCEIKNRTPDQPQYDPQCILAAQQAAQQAAKDAARAAAAAKKK